VLSTNVIAMRTSESLASRAPRTGANIVAKLRTITFAKFAQATVSKEDCELWKGHLRREGEGSKVDTLT
jgi:hypothetical protein